MIFAGKVLKDEETVEFYKLNDGNTIHLVRGGVKKAAPPSSTSPATSATTPAATTPAAPVPNMFGANTASGLPPLSSFTGGPGAMPQMPDMMNNPMFAQMMSQMMANPQMLDMVIQSNPQLAGLITPEMRAQMASPEFQQLVSNPQMLQQMMQMQQMMGGMGGMGGMGAGFNPLANMYGQQVPQQQNPTSNPFLQAMMNNPALAGMGAPNTGSTPAQPPEELYATQLQQLRDMGFYSPQENIRALQMTGGNVEGAVEWLFRFVSF